MSQSQVIATSGRRNTRRKIPRITKGLKEEQERMWGGKASVVFVVIGALGAVTPKLIRGITPEASVQKCTAIETAKILRRTLRLPGLF